MNAAIYERLLLGLETLYVGSKPHVNAAQSYGLKAGSGEAVVLGKQLDMEAVRYLDKMGTEAKELKKGHGAYLRSRVTLDRSTVLTLPDGETYALEQLPMDATVFCPFHVDTVPTGTVHWYADGTPGVQCSHCKRTFAAPTTQRNYDFGFFDRTIRALAAVERQAPTVVSNGVEFSSPGVICLADRYLPPLELERGVTFVKSPKGSGKTEALAGLVAECKKQHLPVLLLGHRRALIQSISTRLGLDCYFLIDSDEESDQPSLGALNPEVEELNAVPDPILNGEGDGKATHYQRVDPTKRYAICLDSMVELDPKDHRYPVIIIDEAEQVFTHLTGETLKGRRREVFARLAHYLKVAQSVYLLDADLNLITMTAAFEVFKPEMPVHVVINEPQIAQGDVRLYGNRGQLAQMLTDTVAAGKKVFVATNSKRKAIDLSKLLLKHCPTARVAVVTADNSQRKETQELLGDITNRFERDLDVLIGSPAIGTGIDITFKDENGKPRQVVDSVFGFFEANIVTHFDIDQQLMRVRHPGEVHVWVDTTALNYETDVGCIKRELEKSVRRTNYLLHYEDDGRPVFSGDGGMVNIWAQVMAASRGSKNRLADLFKALRIEGGWNPVSVEFDEDAAESGKAAMMMAKQSRLAERMDNLLAADKLSSDEAEALAERDKRGLSMTDKERYALERYQIESFYADGDIGTELIEFDSDGRTRECVKRLECLISKREWFEIQDEKDLDDTEMLIFDRRRYLVQRDVLETIFVAAGLFDSIKRRFKTDVAVDAATLKPFLQALEAQRRQVESLFRMSIYEDCWRKPVVQLKGILALVGLDLELQGTAQKDGKKTRRYGISSDMLSRMVRAVGSRDLKYQRDTAERPMDGEDKLTRKSVNPISETLNEFKARQLAGLSSATVVSAEKRKAVAAAFRKRASA